MPLDRTKPRHNVSVLGRDTQEHGWRGSAEKGTLKKRGRVLPYNTSCSRLGTTGVGGFCRESERFMIINTDKSRKELYADYLHSDHWRNLRSQKLILSHYACECCGARRSDGRPIQVHHINYRNWFDCTVDDLLTLCKQCHRWFHLAIERNGNRPEFYTVGQTISMIRNFVESERVTPASVPKNIEREFQRCREAFYSENALKACAKRLYEIAHQMRRDRRRNRAEGK